MPAVSVVWTSWGRRTSAGNMGVQVEGRGGVLTLFTTPTEGTHDGGVWPVADTDRPGAKPITTLKGPGNRAYSFEHRVFHPSPTGNVDRELKALRGIAESGKRVRFFNTSGLATDVWFWVREFKITEEEKGDGHRARSAVVSWVLVEATRFNRVDWSKTPFQEQPPIRIEAHGPEQAEKADSDGDGGGEPTRIDNESGPPAGSGGGSNSSLPSGGAYGKRSAM